MGWYRRSFAVGLILAFVAIRQPCRAGDFPAVHNSESENHLFPMPADEAAARLKLPSGFRATVFASEPDVRNPIAMAWDERGRLWIAENYTYSDRTQRFDLTVRDRVLIFEDRDNDGRADVRKVFTDDVQMLTSVEVGRGGVWLMCPPQLLFIPDADADDVPDGPARVMLDGFDVAQDNYHNFANGLRWGPDGWLYGRCGHSCPGNLGPPGTPMTDRVPIDGGMWRFHPEKNVVEVLCHGTTNPWGHDWDEHGELFFINTVIGHLWHVAPGSHFKESFGESMNPNVYERMDMIADHYHFDTQGNWSESRGGKANDFGGGHAHIGMLIYQHDHWPQQYHGKLMTINMHGMRANVERLERVGTGYVGRHEPDFFIAEDPFFRGIDLSVGPDGNVFVIDWSDTGECHEHTGVHRESGRIYKISFGELRDPQPSPKPAYMQGSGKLQQLWRLYQTGETTPEMLRGLLRDPDEHVRVWAIRLLTDFWPLDTVVGPRAGAVYPDDPATRSEFVRMASEDESGLVWRILASTLQRLPVEHRAELAASLMQHASLADDRDLPLLVWYGLIPLVESDPPALVELARHCSWPRIVRWITRGVASRTEADPQPLDDLLVAACDFPVELQKAVVLGMSDAFRGWRKVPQPAAWEKFASLPTAAESPEIVRELSSLFGDGRALADIQRVVLDNAADVKIRQKALETLIDARPDQLRSICEAVIDVRVLNATAVRGLSLFDDPEIAVQLTRKYRRFHADDRPAVLQTLVSRRNFARVLLDSLADSNSQVPITDINAVHARQIQSLGDESLSRRLSEVWGEVRESSAERRELVLQLKGKLSQDSLARADLPAGRLLFNKTCSQCHVLYGAGKQVGPDLTGSQRANLDYLLENIIDPSAVVGKDYHMSTVATSDGRVLSGLVVSNNDQTLVLQTANEQLTLNVDDIEDLRDTPLSPMPDGLLQNLTDHQIRDLIAYLMYPVQVQLPSTLGD